MNFSRPLFSKRGKKAAFSLVEMIGTLTILSILTAVVAPNLIRRMVETNAAKEAKNLQTLAEGLQRHIQTWQTIPGGSSWITNLASATGLNTSEVRYSDPSVPSTSARVFLIDPAFSPSTGTDPVLTLSSSGTSAPTNARVIFLGCTKRGLALPVTSGMAANTPANRTAFNNVWNWTLNPFTKAPPTGWPAAWTAQGQYLQVQRLNLADQFFRVTVSNANFPTNIPFAKFNQGATYPFDVTNAVDSYYLYGTVVNLYRHDTPYLVVPTNPDELNITHVVRGNVNFVYDGTPVRWRIP